MLKGIALTIKGWFRGQAEAATDLRYAGREHIHEVKQGIEQVRDQRNEVAAKGILLEGRIATLEEQVANDIEAVRHWDAVGDEGKKLVLIQLTNRTRNSWTSYVPIKSTSKTK